VQPKPPPSSKKDNLFLVAYKHFPTGLIATAIGIAFLSAPLLYNLFRDNGFDSVVLRVILSGCVIGVVPLTFLFMVSLSRAPKIRRKIETEELARLDRISGELEALQAQEKKEETEVLRLEQVVKGDIKARKVKDEQETQRWDLLNESLRLQNETVELASEERLLVAQQLKDIKDEGEVMRKGLVSDDLEARHVKDLKEDKRWDQLHAQIEQQNEIAELASEERLLVAQQVKDIKDEGEVMRKGLASDDLEARHIKEDKEEKRWNALHERLRVQEERSEERERRQEQRDNEHVRMRRDDQLKDQYRTLFARFLRNSVGHTMNKEVADGLAPIPQDWLKVQPEILKNPALEQLLAPFNER
jgi:hypothetical protein